MPSWAFEALDLLSGPAAKMDRSLELLEGQMRSNERALRDLNRAQLQSQLLSATGFRYDRTKLDLQRNQLQMARALAVEQRKGLGFFSNLAGAISPVQALRSKVKELGDSLRESARSGGLFRSAMSGMGGMLGTAATALAAVGAGVAGLGAALVVSTARAADFGEAQRRNLQTRFGATEGARQYEVLIEFANRYGMSLETVFRQFNLLSTKGFNQNQIIAMMQGAGDAATVMGDQAAESILTAIGQIKGKGIAQMEELQQQLSERGINIESVLSEIGRARGGLSGGQVRQLISSGQIQAMEAIPAVFRTIQRDFSQGGPMGTAMLNRTRTLAGTIDLIKARWEIFKTRVGETGAFAPVTGFLTKIAELMDGNTQSGRQFQQTLNSLFTGLFGEVGKQDPVKFFQDLINSLKGVGRDAADVFNMLKEIAKGILFIANAARNLKNFLTGNTDQINVGSGISMDESMRGVREGGPSNMQIMAARIDEAAGGAPAPVIRPSTPAGPAAAIAQRNVNVGGITVHVDASGMQSGGATPAEVGQQIADSAQERLSSHLNSAAASQGNPT
jgi:tape measure domain-containing protein